MGRPWSRPLRATGASVAPLVAAVVSAGCSGEAAVERSPTVVVAREVAATAETDPVPNRRDSADDPAIWVNPDDPASGLIVATDKRGGLAVYDLSGRELQYLGERPVNNVDVRNGFPLAGGEVPLVTALRRDDDTIEIHRIDPATRSLVDVAARRIELGIGAYGSCMYRSPETGRFFLFANSTRGDVEQWELLPTTEGLVDARVVRSFEVGSQTEGCVADDELGVLYIGEEEEGIWVYGAEPHAGETRRLVDSTGPEGNLTADVEGLALAYGPDGTGFLIASSQGDDTFAVYRREGVNEYLGSFSIVEGPGVDGVEQTDGIDVTTESLGPSFPGGLFVAQDGDNEDENQNFKLVRWDAIVIPAG